jgi:hypothetical protein
MGNWEEERRAGVTVDDELKALSLLQKWEELTGFNASGLHAQWIRLVRQFARPFGDSHARVIVPCDAAVWPVCHARRSFAGSS